MSTTTIHIKTDKQLVPALRFKEFEDEWEKYGMEQLADCFDGTHQTPKYVESGVPFVSVENVKSYAMKSKFITKEAFDKDFKNKPKTGDIFMTRITAGIIGMTSIVENDDDLAYYVSVALIRRKGNIESSFLAHRIESEGFKRELHKRIIHVAFPKKINLGDLQKCITYTPSTLPEQQKIASFLSVVDEKIQQLTKKKELLEQYKKGVMQQLFSGKLRFKDENGNPYPDWDWVGGNELFDNISDKKHNSDLPILAITQDQGAIPRDMIDYKMTVTEKSVASYKVVQVGDFVISLRTFQGGIEFSNYHGICSPAYIILRPSSEDVDRVFYKFYLKTSNYINQLQKNLEGIRDGKMISYKYFSEIKVPFPSHPEQQKIARYLSSIDTKIDAVNNQITQTQTYKKGLLQQMFV